MRRAFLLSAAMAGCEVADSEDLPPEFVSALALDPEDGQLTLAAGESTTVHIQTMDEFDRGVNGVEVFFATADPELALDSEEGSGEAASLIRLTTKRSTVSGFGSAGIGSAVVDVSSDAVSGETYAIWVGLVSLNGAPDADSEENLDLPSPFGRFLVEVP